MPSKMCLLVFIAVKFVYQALCEDPTVLTSQGVVRGLWSDDGSYSMFMGIPFALVDPENPFGDALPGPKFEGTFKAHNDSAMCPQVDLITETIMGNLDCLHLNVYVPRSASVSNPLPVMVWIYGGAYRLGSAGRYTHGPDHLVPHGVILVTISYRLGPYGFMCLDIPTIPGNTGLKDQRRALEWVKDNIFAFGGEVNSITAFGFSAGAHSLEFHMLSPGSKGLFQRVIFQSGSALAEEVIVDSRPSAPQELARVLGFDTDTMEKALEIIKKVPTDDLIRAHRTLGITFKPCVEKIFEGTENFLTDYPNNLLASGQYESMPMIVGYNTHEQLKAHFSAARDQKSYFVSLQDIVLRKLNASFALPEEEIKIVSKIVQDFYFGSKPINMETVYELIEFDSDISYLHPIERSIAYHRANSDKPIYQYVFAYEGDINYFKVIRNITAAGVSHGDEIGYLFKQAFTKEETTPADQIIIDQMCMMWTNFAKYGNPTPELSELLPVRWPTVTDARDYLLIGPVLQVKKRPFHRRMAFWDLMFEVFGKFFKKVWPSCQYCVSK